jgi:predicted DCC family thiol-disulfide oxidoreductase YuxK
MKNGWTGGQYSVYRAVFGVYLLIHFAALIPWSRELFVTVLPRDASALLHLFPNILAIVDVATSLLVLAAIAAILFAFGLFDRIAAVVMWYVLACLFGRNPLIANPSLPFVGWLLLAHALLPPAPYGSWPARKRTDPRGGWTMPPLLFEAAWIVMSLGYTFSGWTKLVSPSWVDGTAMARVLANPLARPSAVRDLVLTMPGMQLATWGALALELLYAPLAFFRRARPWIWTAMLLMHLGLMVLIDFADLSFAMVILHFFTFDPAWIRGRDAEVTETVYYDGTCGLCHRAVRFILAEDRSGTAFALAPLGGDRYASEIGEMPDLPDSVIVRTASGEVLVKSAAIIRIAQRLGGLWRVLGTLFALVPRAIRDAGYDFVARIRYRIFGREKNACPLLPPDLRARFSA